MYKTKSIVGSSQIIYISLLRIVATFAVVLIHVSATWGDNTAWWNSFVNFVISPWCVPVFVMITGALFLDSSKTVTYRSICHNIGKLLLALFFWSVTYNFISLSIIDYKLSFATIVQALKMMLVADTTFAYQLWYLYMSIGLYLILPVLNAFVSRFDKFDNEFLLSVTIVFTIVLPFFAGVFSDQIDVSAVWKSAFVYFNGFVVYLLSGAYINVYNLSRRTVCALIVTTCVLYLVVIVNPFVRDCLTGYTTPLSFTTSATIFYFIKKCSAYLSNFPRLVSTINICAKNCFGVYLLHVMMIQAIRKIFDINWIGDGHVFWIVTISVVVFVCCIYLSAMMKKIPILKQVV